MPGPVQIEGLTAFPGLCKLGLGLAPDVARTEEMCVDKWEGDGRV